MIAPISYDKFAKLPASEKCVLIWLEPSVRFLLWALDSGAIYKRSVDNYVVEIYEDGTKLTEVSSAALNSGEWYFDYENKEVYIRTSDDASPQSKSIRGDYRLFLSDRPTILSHDLDGGNPVPYEPLVGKSSAFNNELDIEDQIGIALESKGSLEFLNPADEGYWVDKFDKYFFENKKVKVFSWSPLILETQRRQLFSGTIENKAFDKDKVSFRIKDFIHLLKRPITVDTYTPADGNISQDILGTPKRRVYGRVEGLLCQSTDQALGQISIGNVTGAVNSTTITGTNFLTNLSQNDEFSVTVDDEVFIYSIDKVVSDTSATLSEKIESGFLALEGFIDPAVPSAFVNRDWMIAGHKLREPSTTISVVQQRNRIEVVDTTDLFPGNEIRVNSAATVTIKRISGDLLILNQNLPFVATVGMTVVKSPIDKVFFKNREFFINRDWALTNGPLDDDDAVLNFNSLAEFNVATTRSVIGTVDFDNASRIITGTNTKFLQDFKVNDWIKNETDLTHQTWYKIVNILTDETLEVRAPYGGGTLSTSANKKNIAYFDDESLVTTNCDGMEKDGEWKHNAARIIKDLLIDSGIDASELNDSSFTEAEQIAPYIMSLALPFMPSGTTPKIRNVINIINRSVIGSIVSKDDFLIHFNILTPERPFDVEEIKDDDIIDFKVNTKTSIIRKVTANYRHFDADRATGESGVLTTVQTSDFVDDFIGAKNAEEFDLYIFDDVDAETMAQRILLMKSLTQSTTEVTSKLRLGLFNLNDKVIISLDRLYKRFGDSGNTKKMGIISKIKRSSTDVAATFSDLGNLFNRVANICDDSTVDFTASDESVRIKSSYIVDDALEVPDTTSEDEYGSNIIG